MKKKSRLKRAEGILPFTLEEVEGQSHLTAHAGLPLVAETFRASGAWAAVDGSLRTRSRLRERGLTDAELVESFCVLLAAGGECIEDFNVLREDEALASLIGHEFPSPARAKEFLYAFERQEGRGAEVAGQGALWEGGGPLAGLAEALRATLRAAQRERPVQEATIDLDATIIESEKRQAQMTYRGERGYQPVLALWAEKDMVLADEFRDGNVPAGTGLLDVLKAAVAALPEGVEKVSLRSDSAGYEHRLLNWCRDEAHITFAISADMSVELRSAIEALPAEAWGLLEVKGGVARSWAEVEFIPSAPSVVKGRRPDRYVAIKLEPAQGELFADGTRVKYYAVVTNDWARPGGELLEWHRQKAGTVEKLHDVLKNELGAGVMPCGRFGANAAWLRLNALTQNVLALLKQTALPEELRKARPKRLRFLVLCVAGQVIHHARSIVLRVVRGGRVMGWLGQARRALSAMQWRARAPSLAAT